MTSRSRRRLRAKALLWVAATAAVTSWWAIQTSPAWYHIPLTAAVFALLLGAALTTPDPRRS